MVADGGNEQNEEKSKKYYFFVSTVLEGTYHEYSYENADKDTYTTSYIRICTKRLVLSIRTEQAG